VLKIIVIIKRAEQTSVKTPPLKTVAKSTSPVMSSASTGNYATTAQMHHHTTSLQTIPRLAR